MNRPYNISIAIATYNGEKFIKEQLESILKQINENDEIVISDDGSTDNTIKIIKSFNDPRIRVFHSKMHDIKQNFSNAINKCNGKYIFLCDQDDIWMNNKITTVLKYFDENKNIKCIVHDCVVFDETSNNIIEESYFKYRNSKKGIIHNILKNSYIGCCMAFDNSLKKYILPIPNNINMHDQWIGLICEKYYKSLYINEKLIKYRRHNNNATNMKHNSIIKMLKDRFYIIINLLKK